VPLQLENLGATIRKDRIFRKGKQDLGAKIRKDRIFRKENKTYRRNNKEGQNI
jgi:hypothetical protein